MATVYRTNDKGIVTKWRAWAEEDDRGNGILYTQYGTMDGQQRTSRRVISDQGREVSPLAKAWQQAKKKMQDKIDVQDCWI